MRSDSVVVVLSDLDQLPATLGFERVLAADFISGRVAIQPGAAVVNLCVDRGYLSTGWYVSLLTEARGGVPLPEPALLEESLDRCARDRALREEGLDLLDSAEISARACAVAALGLPPCVGVPVIDDPDEPAPRSPRPEEQLRFRVLAGRPSPAVSPQGAPSLARLARRVFEAWPLPMAEVDLVHDSGHWRLTDLRPIGLNQLSVDDLAVLLDALPKVRLTAAPPFEGMPSLAVLWSGAVTVQPGTS